MESLDEFQMICLEKDNDYDQSSAGSGLSQCILDFILKMIHQRKEPILSYVER